MHSALVGRILTTHSCFAVYIYLEHMGLEEFYSQLETLSIAAMYVITF